MTLRDSLVAVANGAGLTTVALITDMDRVLGRNVGNALEVVEAVEYLKGEGTREPRLHAVTMALAGEMIALGGLSPAPWPAGRAPRRRWPTGARRRSLPAWCRRSAGRTTSWSIVADILPVRRPSSPARPNARAMSSA